MSKIEDRYLERLSQLYPTIAAASTEIINLTSILNLPKGTEHFITDIHGEYEAFSHVLRNGSGAVKKKIRDVFGRTLSSGEIDEIATLIYYPTEKIALVKKESRDFDMENWYQIMLYRLIEVCRYAASKYTRSKVRKAMPADFAYVIEELITEKADIADKEAYYDAIIRTIISTGRADSCIKALAELIRRLVVDHLHILGDIYDRGYGPDDIMDVLMDYHSLDIQWGNHDILWLGAACGQIACICNVVRICARYGNLDLLEEGYGINILPLARFASKTYGSDPCGPFGVKGEAIDGDENELNIRIHKAISIIQFKVEANLAATRSEYGMDKDYLGKIDYKRGVITLDGSEYPLSDTALPTVDPADPNKLSDAEKYVVERLQSAFLNCKRLQKHMEFLLRKGSLYTVYNGNLLFHGCVPLEEDGSFKEVEVYGKKLRGRYLYDELDSMVRIAYFSVDEELREKGRDILWWIWCNENSPLFGKKKMATFERYMISDPATHKEEKTPYYKYLDDVKVVERILSEFGLEGEHTHIVNGHVPVKRGEVPTRCGGRVLVIDGGFSKAYQGETGIAGYTLIFNSWGLRLVSHMPFTSMEDAVMSGTDIHSDSVMVEQYSGRLSIGDTDIGQVLKDNITDLEKLLVAYRSGVLNQRV